MYRVEAYGLLIKRLYFLHCSAINRGSCKSEVIILEFMEQNQSPPLDIVLGIRIVFHLLELECHGWSTLSSYVMIRNHHVYPLAIPFLPNYSAGFCEFDVDVSKMICLVTMAKRDDEMWLPQVG